MTKIRDSDGKHKAMLQKGKDRADEEAANTSRNDVKFKLQRMFDLFYCGNKPRRAFARGREQGTTDFSSDIGSDVLLNDDTNGRKRSLVSFLRIIFVTVVVIACFIALALALRIVVFSRNGQTDGDIDKLIESTGETHMSPSSSPFSVDSDAEKNEKDPSMVIVEVTERSLTSGEINEGIEKDNLSLARASADIGAVQDVAENYGKHKRTLEEQVEACDPCEYYKPIIFWTRNDVQRLLQYTHQELDFFGGVRNTRTALLDLDRIDSNSDDVYLLYSNKTGEDLGGGSFTWNREHVWPCDRGVRCSRGNPDYTDIHNMFPADREVNIARGNRFFDDLPDDCTDVDGCVVLEDTIKYSNEIFQPPGYVRGVVARVIFYMDLRYTHLELTDNPDLDKENLNQMAYLSTLLQWHEEYPPEAKEIERNNRACSEWQGNRNPFIDYPELAGIIYGTSTTSKVRVPSPACREETDAPTPETPPEPMLFPSDWEGIKTSTDESSNDLSNSSTRNERNALFKLMYGILLFTCIFLSV